MAKLKENLTMILDDALAKIELRNSEPIEILGKEKHADDLCAHFVWNNGQQTVFLCPKAVEKGAIFGPAEEALRLHPELAEKLETLSKNDREDSYAKKLSPLTTDSVVLFIPRKMCQKREFLLDLELSDEARAALLKVFVIIDDDASAVVTINLHSRGTNAENLFAGQFYCTVGKNAHLVLNEIGRAHV